MATPKFACHLTLLIALSLGMCSATKVHPVPRMPFMDAVVFEPSPPKPIPSPEWPSDDLKSIDELVLMNPPSLDELSLAIQGLTHAMKAKCDCEYPFGGAGSAKTDLTSAIQGLTIVMKDKCDCSSPLNGRGYTKSDLTSAIQELANAIKATTLSITVNGHA